MHLIADLNKNKARNRAGKQHKKDKLKELTATLVVEGDPLVVANSIIYIKGVADVHEGAWYVKKVTHAISRSSGYTTTLELQKNATNVPATANSTDLRATNASTLNTFTETKKIVESPKTDDGRKLPMYDANSKLI